MAFDQSENTAAAGSAADKPYPNNHEAQGIELQAYAVEAEARALEVEVRQSQPDQRAHESATTNATSTASMSDLLTAMERSLALCQQLLDQNPTDWDKRASVQSLRVLLEGFVEDVRAVAGATKASGQSGTGEGSSKASSGKK